MAAPPVALGDGGDDDGYAGQSMDAANDEPDFGGDDVDADGGDASDAGGGGGDDDWMKQLDVDDKGVRKTASNLSLIMKNDPVLSQLGRNIMGGGLAWKKLPYWRRGVGAKVQKDPSLRKHPSYNDTDRVRAHGTLRDYFGGLFSAVTTKACDAAITTYASLNSFNPWTDYLDSLPAWDGEARVERAISCVADTPYTRQVFLNFLLGMMDRAFRPGSQVDSLMVFYGPQGVRKTSWFRALVPDDTLYLELSDIPDASRHKDSLIQCHQVPLVVFDELDRMWRKNQQSALKAFVTGRVDTYRRPYAHEPITAARSFIMAGTTNQTEFLLDTTGNRLYWPIEIPELIPAEELTREYMDLLLAEARDRYRGGERVESGEAFEALAEDARAINLNDPIEDPIEDAVYDWLDNPIRKGAQVQLDVSVVSVNYIATNAEALEHVDTARNRKDVNTIASVLDNHPEYRRIKLSAGACIRVGGRQAKRAWERLTPTPGSVPAAAPPAAS